MMRKHHLLTLIIFSVVFAAAAFFSNVARANDVPIQGGPGGGGFRLPCPGNTFMLGVALRSGAWVDAIRGNCLAFNGKEYVTPPQFTNFTGGTGGALQQNGCSPDRYLAAIKIGFTRDDNRPKYLDYVEMTCRVLTGYGGDTKVCLHTGDGCWDRHPSPGPYNGFGLSFTLACPANQAATGLFGRSGSYVDALGLICGPKPVVSTSTSSTTTPTTTPPPATGTLGAQVLKFATDRLDKCVDAAEKTRNEHCPPLPMGSVGDGECTHLVQAALDSVGARNNPGQYDWGRKVSESPYKSTADIQPGDVIQLFKVELDDPRGKNFGWWSTGTQHTAIIEKNDGGVLTVLEQNSWVDNTNRRYVTRGTINLTWKLVSGNFIIYRAEKTAGFVRRTREAVRTSGYRQIFRPNH